MRLINRTLFACAITFFMTHLCFATVIVEACKAEDEACKKNITFSSEFEAIAVDSCEDMGTCTNSATYFPEHGEVPIQLGVLMSQAGAAQRIQIQGLIGNQYTVNSETGFNLVVT
jgi:hypothetical protein